jgi:hypothetical protein
MTRLHRGTEGMLVCMGGNPGGGVGEDADVRAGVPIGAGVRTTVVSEYGGRVCVKVRPIPDLGYEEIDALCIPYEYTVALEAGLYPDGDTVRV